MARKTKWLRNRGVLVGASLVAMVIGSSAIALWAAYRLPAPEHATERDLMRWLVTRDLRAESRDTQRALIRRFEHHLADANDLGASSSELNDERRAMLEINVDVLLPEWVALGTERYEALASPTSVDFLDRQLLLVERVSDLYAVITRSSRDASGADAVLELVDAVDEIVGRATLDKQESFGRFVRAMKLRWFTTTDLSQLDYDSLVALTARVEEELRSGTRFSDVESSSDPRQDRQLWRNIDVVGEVWFRKQIDVYAALPTEKRSAHVARLVEDVAQWPVVQDQLKPLPAAESKTINPLGLLMNNPLARAMQRMSVLEQRVDAWTSRAPASDKPQMREFVSHAKSALRRRFLKQFVKGGASS